VLIKKLTKYIYEKVLEFFLLKYTGRDRLYLWYQLSIKEIYIISNIKL